MNKKTTDKVMKNIFQIVALITILSIILITTFLTYKGTLAFWDPSPTVETPTVFNFLTGNIWDKASVPAGVEYTGVGYEIGYMILGTLLSIIGAALIAVPIAIISALTIAKYTSKKVSFYLQTVIELLAGIPSVIYGVFGLGLIVPQIAKISPTGSGRGLLAVILVLAIMILPTIISIAITSIKSVPKMYEEASLGLGATKIQTSYKVILPAAKSGIIAAVILGIGRAIGETMAIILVAGNTENGYAMIDSLTKSMGFTNGIPNFLFQSIRPMTSNIALEMGYSSGTGQDLLFSTGFILLIFILLLNVFVYNITKKKVGRS